MNLSELKTRLSKSLAFFESELAKIRTGRVSPALLENLPVAAYGAKMTLKELGSIVLVDARNLLISPWDKNLIADIARAIRESDLNLNPVIDGDAVRVPVPALTEDRRKELSKLVSAKLEDCKITMRNIRQEAMKDIERAFSNKELSEDEKFAQKESIEDIVKEFILNAEDLCVSKKEDVMHI